MPGRRIYRGSGALDPPDPRRHIRWHGGPLDGCADFITPLVLWTGPPLTEGGDPVVYRLDKESDPWRYEYVPPANIPAILESLKPKAKDDSAEPEQTT